MKVFLHIGLHKSGTTYLQNCIFPNLKNIQFGGKGFNLNLNKNNLVISNESFSGVPYHQNEKSYFEQFKNNILNLNHLYKINGIIIGFREPNSILKSFYKQHLHEGGTLTFDEFFGKDHNNILNPCDFIFSKFYDFLIDVFTEKKVFAYDHKDLIVNHDLIIRKLQLYLNTELDLIETDNNVNKSIGDNFEKHLLRLNRLNVRVNKIGLNLYHPKLVKMRLTPRYLFQIRLDRFRKKTYDLDVFDSDVVNDWKRLQKKIEKQ